MAVAARIRLLRLGATDGPERTRPGVGFGPGLRRKRRGGGHAPTLVALYRLALALDVCVADLVDEADGAPLRLVGRRRRERAG
jgi:hypothetical protein